VKDDKLVLNCGKQMKKNDLHVDRNDEPELA
jgi:hypothetical protein